jgi:hypothetical protein
MLETNNINIFSYKLSHDYGLAPNPFGDYCTLAVCKSKIRKNKNLSIGDWVIGCGSKKLNLLHHLIYAMRVEEKILFNDYWEDPRFQYKKPIVTGDFREMYGDNFYHKNSITKEWIQENSAHSLEEGKPNLKHLKRDIGGKYVLVSKEFYYWGNKSQKIPDHLIEVCCDGRDMKSSSIPQEIAIEFINWLKTSYTTGQHGIPISWANHYK